MPFEQICLIWLPSKRSFSHRQSTQMIKWQILKENMQIYNLGQKSICRLSHVLEQLPPTTSEMELDYHEEVDK